jgi:hypothetical protein
MARLGKPFAKKDGKFDSPVTQTGALKLITDAAVYLHDLENVLSTKIFPLFNRVLTLASGNRSFDSAMSEVTSKYEDAETQQLVYEARLYYSQIVELLDSEAYRQVNSVEDNSRFVSEINREAVTAQLAAAVDVATAMSPSGQIAPGGYAYDVSTGSWILDLAEQNISSHVYAQGTPTGDTDAAALTHAGGGTYYKAFYLSDDDTSGNITLPAKADSYDWRCVISVSGTLTNANGGASAGDIAAAETTILSVFAFTSATLGGSTSKSTTRTVKAATALTNSGAQVYDWSVELPIELEAGSVDGNSSVIHIDYAFGNVTTAGGSGLTMSNLKFDRIRMIGYLKTASHPYANITYNDGSKIRSITKAQRFVDLFGACDFSSRNDPNLSVEALWNHRIGSKMHILGAVVQMLKAWSARYHASGSTIDDKYQRLGCTGGITDLLGGVSLLDRTVAPFGNTLTGTITDPDDIAYIMVTFLTDIKMIAENVNRDDTLAAYATKYLSFTNSANVHY